MNKNKAFILFGIVFFLAFYFIGCRKDPIIRSFTPTPFTLSKPYTFLPFLPVNDNPMTKEGIQLGRMLFYDPILSENGTLSCEGCHNQAFAFTDNGLRVSEGIKGIAGTRNSMPIFNLNWHDKGFFWDGRAATLREQILMPIEDPIEMASTVNNALKRINSNSTYPSLFYKAFGVNQATEVELAKAIEQFMLTIISSNSKFDKWRKGEIGLTQDELDGLAFTQAENNPRNGLRGGDCFHCHGTAGDLFTNSDFFNNGLDASLTDLGKYNVTGLEVDKGKFKTPSLRNLGFTGPYMHDGRFKTIEEVLDHYGDHVVLNSPNLDPNMRHSRSSGQIKFTREEKDKMIAFLNSLNDSTLVTNPAFSNPF
jgi:cytochrome c peroxidase